MGVGGVVEGEMLFLLLESVCACVYGETGACVYGGRKWLV